MEQASSSTLRHVQRALRGRSITPSQGGTVYAYANHGRWVADCPCKGAELVAEGEPMVCGTCGKAHQVVFPADRAAIDGVLEKRPAVNQNWLPGETVEALEAENLTRGIR